MSFQVRARVLAVRVLPQGGYGVTIGAPPRMAWLSTLRPPRLGQLIQIDHAVGYERKLADGAFLVVIEHGEVSVIREPYPRRVVGPEWIRQVKLVMDRDLLGFQLEAAAWMASRLATGRGVILCDDPGLGKTTQTLAALLASKSLPALVVCPTSIKHGWLAELKHVTADLKAVVVEGQQSSLEPAHILIMSYAVLKSREKQLQRIGLKGVVFDEGHLLKEPVPGTGHRAAVGTRLAQSIGRPVILTGTPVMNRPTELWRLLHIVDKDRWPNYASFYDRYCTAPQKGEIDVGESILTKHAKVKRIKELQVLTDPYLIRRRRSEVLQGMLLPKHHLRMMVELEPADRKSYDDAERDVVSWLKRVASDERALAAAKGQAIVKINMLRRIAAMGKLRRAAGQFLQAWVNGKSGPLVIFAHHRAVLLGLRRICGMLGIKISHVTGEMSAKRRGQNVDRFQAGKTQVFIGPIMAAGVGINLYRASHMLCLERLWSPSVMEQMESRCHRIGQKRHTVITYMDAKGTVDEHIAEVLQSKQRVISRVVDDERLSRKQETERSAQEVISRLLAR